MSISRIEMQGQITRAQDFTTIKHNEDNKGQIDQANFQISVDKNADDGAHHVNDGERAENRKNATDGEGRGESYQGDGGRKRQKPKDDLDRGKMIVKGRSGFDLKI